MSYSGDKKGDEWLKEAVDFAENVMDRGLSRETAISSAAQKFDLPKDVLKRWVSRPGVELIEEEEPEGRFIPKPDGTKFFATK